MKGSSQVSKRLQSDLDRRAVVLQTVVLSCGSLEGSGKVCCPVFDLARFGKVCCPAEGILLGLLSCVRLKGFSQVERIADLDWRAMVLQLVLLSCGSQAGSRKVCCLVFDWQRIWPGLLSC